MKRQNEETAFDRLDIYEKVKILEGENFVTVEDMMALSAEEVITFIRNFEKDLAFGGISTINILISHKFAGQVLSVLEEEGFRFQDEVVVVHRNLTSINQKRNEHFVFRNLNELSKQTFMHVWEQSMIGSPNAPSSLTIQEQMRSVEKELGSDYKSSCIVVYEKDCPIGVVMPHIEPGTTEEGRLFYFGLIPEERGKGKSKTLHDQALDVLRDYFKASYYIGSTSTNNIPMLRTFEANGCTVMERNKLYKRSLI